MMDDHDIALSAVIRNPDLPKCSDYRLSAAASDGLIRFSGWPAGHWRLTDAGREYLAIRTIT